jgi:PPOX class probable F420-dependent enzyme
MELIPNSHLDLLQDERKAIAILSTVMSDGSPQSTPVWFDTEDGLIRVNTARGRVKDENMSLRPAVAVVILDPESTYRYVQIRGLVVKSMEDGARVHIDLLAKKYLGQRTYENYDGETRVMYFIKPISVSVMG